ncbi:nucleoside-diphosphate sugar epimerase/dehydratase [Pedobacter sp. B4-66]|uniref:polysaccharide biosynthesis protein n=1 Tax=Pedobacter sp. B4-66 TaxID=2817280 RepID=UPI001BD9FDB8|nr:nucleoside-diphosphate sugar epimerase/dehydratase [Pedobacter sp. B4-66]
MIKLILPERIHSKWLILFIDQVIIICTLCLAIFLTNGNDYAVFFNGQNHLFIWVYSFISVGVFVFLKVNTGIIRYSNTEDMLRIFLAVFSVSLLFMSVYAVFFQLFPLHFAGFEKALILNFFISSSLLVLLRITVRALYNSIKNLGEIKKENILIYGTTHHSLLIKKAIDQDNTSNLNIVGFIDDDIDRVDKHIEQKNVFAFRALSLLKNKYQIARILISENALSTSNKIKFIDLCGNAEIPMVKVPSADKWLYGKFATDQLKDLKIDDLLEREPIRLDKQNILRELSGKRILITGAAGSIGSEIVRQAINYHPQMLILCDQAETPLHDLKLCLEDNLQADNVKVFMANIQNPSRIRTLFELYKPEIVFHAAAYKHVPMMEENPSEAVLTNVLGTKNLADLCVEFEVEKFVMISTDKAVKPTNVMGASKRLAEIYIQSLNSLENRVNGTVKTRFITTRFGNVLGSNGSVIPRFKSQIERRTAITVTHPDITRYFMTIPEAVELVLEAGAMGKGGEIFLFDMGKPIKIIDLALNMIKLAGLKPYVDIDIVFTGLRPGEKIYEELLLLEEKAIATHHPKIKISQNIAYNYLYVSQIIKDLIDISQKGDDFNMVRKMKEILPDFISNNSRYQELDLLEAN